MHKIHSFTWHRQCGRPQFDSLCKFVAFLIVNYYYKVSFVCVSLCFYFYEAVDICSRGNVVSIEIHLMKHAPYFCLMDDRRRAVTHINDRNTTSANSYDGFAYWGNREIKFEKTKNCVYLSITELRLTTIYIYLINRFSVIVPPCVMSELGHAIYTRQK